MVRVDVIVRESSLRTEGVHLMKQGPVRKSYPYPFLRTKVSSTQTKGLCSARGFEVLKA